MQFKRIGATLIILGIIFCNSNLHAGDIEAGTFSVGASSNALFSLADYDDGHSKVINLDAELGYFFFKNWEVGLGVGLRFVDYGDHSAERYSLLPYIGYHWPLNDKSNIYGLVGGGYGWGTDDYDDGYSSDSEVTTIFAEVGYEYFVSRNISLGLGVRGEQSEHEFESEWDDGISYERDTTEKALSTQLSFKLYF